jgi:iron(III) transport system substrate-binding protein
MPYNPSSFSNEEVEVRGKARVTLLATVAALAGAACGGDDEPAAVGEPASGGGETIVVYSGREEEIVEPLFTQFEEQTGIRVEARYGDSAELAATLAEEGGGSPADVFFAQDAGSLGAVASEGLLARLPEETVGRVDPRFRDADRRWVGTSGRVRVIAYNTDAIAESELPASVLELTDPRYEGKIGLPPTNASFQAFVSALRITVGDDATRAWLDGIEANEPRIYEKNSQVLEALAVGEIELGLVNHYYLFLLRKEQPDAPVENHYLVGDAGGLVNVAGVGILASSERAGIAQQFVDFLLSDEGQRFYTERAEEAEYPIVEGIPARAGLPPLGELQGPDVSLGELGELLPSTLEMISEAGLTL